MRTISNDFREALRGIRQLDALVTYQSESTTKYITTEIGQNITTELNELLGAELGDVVFEGEQILSLNPLFSVELFKTICNSVVIEAKSEIPINTWLNVKIGVLVNNSYEFLDFGDYYVTESKYEADTKSYIITAYDKMVEAMKPFDLSVTYPITVKNLLINIFNKLGWEYELDTFVNQDKIIETDLFSNQNLTFRDVLDDISQVAVGNIGFDKKVAKIKYISPLESSTQIPFEIPQILNVGNISEDRYITEEDLKDVNVTINQKYGPVNSILITSNDVVLNNLQDSSLVEKDGLTEYEFKDNRILIYNSDNFINDMFNAIKGLEFYLYDFDTFGKLCFEPLDEVIIRIDGVGYKTLILNDDIKLTTGLEETMYADIPENTTNEYIVNDKLEKKVNNALISIDKANAKIELNAEAINGANAEIVLKVNSSGKIVQVQLGANPNAGSVFNVDADNINLTANDILNLISGNSINLSSKNITINSTNFNVDTSGNMSCNNANVSGTINSSNGNIAGFNMNSESFSKNVSGIYNYDYFDLAKAMEIVMEYIGINGNVKNILDYNNDNVINSQDFQLINMVLSGQLTNSKTANGTYQINSSDPKRLVSIKDSGGNIISSMGLGGIDTIYLTANNIICGNQSNTQSYYNFITLNGNTGAIRCVSLTQTSKEEVKKNFEKLNNALDIIKSTDIYKYNLKTQNDNDKKHIGFIIGDNYKYSEELTSNNDDGVDLYSFVSVCCKAIQEQQEQIEELEKRIEILERKNK